MFCRLEKGDVRCYPLGCCQGDQYHDYGILGRDAVCFGKYVPVKCCYVSTKYTALHPRRLIVQSSLCSQQHTSGPYPEPFLNPFQSFTFFLLDYPFNISPPMCGSHKWPVSCLLLKPVDIQVCRVIENVRTMPVSHRAGNRVHALTSISNHS